jgi:hypothetical protein
VNLTRLLVAALVTIYGCGTSSSVSPTQSAAGSSYTSSMYGYSVTVPAGWQTKPAKVRWDGSGAPAHEDPAVDIVEPTTGTMSIFAFAAPTTLDLDGYAREVVARNAQFHGDTCPPTPDKIESTTAGGQPASYISWNCGILINAVAVVRNGVGYQFVMRDPGVNASSDPTDRQAFDGVLKSLIFPT